MSKLEEKKKHMAAKMQGGGMPSDGDKKTYRRDKAQGKRNTKQTTEDDFDQKFYEDRFSKGDVSKEKSARNARNKGKKTWMWEN